MRSDSGFGCSPTGSISNADGTSAAPVTIEIPLWKPTFKHDDTNSLGSMWNIEDAAIELLPYQPLLKLLRETMIESYKKPHIEAKAAGTVRLQIHTITNGFSTYGVQL
jgi:hypothetical protein